MAGSVFKATVVEAQDGSLSADDGGSIWSLIFEEGYWGYRSGFNKLAVRKTKPESSG